MHFWSQCSFCSHLREGDGGTIICEAYPKDIPDDLMYNRVMHNKPLPTQTGDTTFLPIPDAPSELVQAVKTGQTQRSGKTP